MTKMRWATMSLMFLGAYVVQAFGCSSSPAPAGTSGGACCACTVSDTASGCSNSKTLKPLAAVADCTSFCAGQASALQMCPTAATPTISGSGVACPATLGGEGGTIVTVDGSIVHPEGGVIGGGKFGAQCQSAADCGGGLICLKATDDIVTGTPGGFPNGICTIDCSMDATACDAVNGLCVGFDPDPNAVNPRSICLENCVLGTPAQGEVKCNNRPDVACDSVSQVSTACVPFCTTDADCGGRKCSSGGACTDTPRAGTPLGGPCTTDKDTACAGGLCLPVVDSVDGGPAQGICSAYCVLGTMEACDWRRTAVGSGPPIGACLAPVLDTGGGGDLGFCFLLCDADKDCPTGNGWFCDHNVKGVDSTFNHGVCQIQDADAAAPATGDQ